MNDSHAQMMPYQESWPEKFAAEKEKLQEVFGDKALEYAHIGSTSVPGLKSKPIIDIAVMVENQEDADSFVEPLADLGYVEATPRSTERHFFTKGDPIAFHLSIAYAGRGGFWPRQIYFRDYLRTHPEVCDAYAQLKTELLEKDTTGKEVYVEGKSDFVQRVLDTVGFTEGETYRDFLKKHNS